MNVRIQVSITALILGTVLISRGLILVLVPPGSKEMGGKVELVVWINYLSLGFCRYAYVHIKLWLTFLTTNLLLHATWLAFVVEI